MEGASEKTVTDTKIKDYFSPTTTTTKMMMCNFNKNLKLIQCFSIRVRPPVCRKLATVSSMANCLLKLNRKLFNTEEERGDWSHRANQKTVQRSNTAAVIRGLG